MTLIIELRFFSSNYPIKSKIPEFGVHSITIAVENP